MEKIEDLEVGMVLEGVVTNVTRFGCFVDVGVHQDGLVHISELSHKFLKDPSEAVKAGQIVTVKVLQVEAKAKRIGLSMKALTEGPVRPAARPVGPAVAGSGRPPIAGPGGRPGQGVGANRPPVGKAAPSMEEKLAALGSKWKTR